MDIRDKVALITGAARRVGRAAALRLADGGCHVAVHYNRSESDALACAALCRERGVQASVFAADLADLDATAGLIPEVEAQFGRLDILVNNASVFERMTLDQFDARLWERTMRVNLTAPILLSHAAQAAFKRVGGGRIVNLCDSAAAHPWPDRLAYITSKGALETLTKALARAMAPDVNVVGIAPGVAAWPDEYDREERERLTARIPLQRAGTVEEIAAAVYYILTDGDYMTGTILTLDGGRHLR